VLRYRLDGDRLRYTAQDNTGNTDSYARLSTDGALRFLERRHVEALTDAIGTINHGEVFYGNQSGLEADRLTLLALRHEGETFYVTSLAGGTGLGVQRYEPGADFRSLYVRSDTSESYATDVRVLASYAHDNGRSFVFAGSMSESGVSSYEFSENGLGLRDSLGVAEGLGIRQPSVLRVVETGDTAMLLVGASGTGTISVMEISATGRLSLLDHVTDDLNTRFGGVAQLETITIEGQVFVVAGGNDGGIALFRLLPNGQLLHVESMEDRTDLGLRRINSIHLEQVDTTLHVFVTSESKPGITHLTLDLSDIGQALSGSSGADRISGGAEQSQIWGGDGDDTLNGGGGDDVLIGGAGRDRLSGGAGADLFVGDVTEGRDDILDFELGVDRIDLSAWGRLYSIADLTIASRSDGARIRFEGHDLILRTDDGRALSYEDFLEVDVFGLYRPPPEIAEPVVRNGGSTADALNGASGNDRLNGRAGNDTIDGGDGNDRLSGGEDDDVVFGGNGADTIQADAGQDQVYGGDQDDMLVGGDGADLLLGELGNDTLEGGSGLDQLNGGSGDDSLLGGTGMDTLEGAAGNDTLYSNSAADLVFGGDGHDLISGGESTDILHGDAGNDTLLGRTGADTIYGGAGLDSIVASAGRDSIFGGEGDDYVSAGSARDSVYGDAGDDVIYGNTGSDLLEGGRGDDDLNGGGGADTLLGGAGQDTLFGNQGFDRLEGGTGNDELRGGGFADTFVFDQGHDRDVIVDFEAGVDILSLSASLARGLRDTEDVVARFARGTSDGVLFDFGEGDRILLEGLTETSGLVGSIEIF
jgi:Ca2+-binding RTX toxin-like protein